MVSLLEGLGYQVFAAETGREALDLWEKNRSDIALLFTDIVLPENMSGIDLADNLLEQQPGLPVVITSGYRLDSISNADKVQRLGVFIPKPYVPREIVRLFREVLDQ